MSCSLCAKREALRLRMQQQAPRVQAGRGRFIRFLSSTTPRTTTMSDTNNRPNQDASLRGDTKPMPDRGSMTGTTGYDMNLDGASLDMDATNRLGAIGRQTVSDKAGEGRSDDDPAPPSGHDLADDDSNDKPYA